MRHRTVARHDLDSQARGPLPFVERLMTPHHGAHSQSEDSQYDRTVLRLYAASLDGKVTVFKSGGEKPEVLHQTDFRERIAATPALVGQRLYVRTQTKLYAFGK